MVNSINRSQQSVLDVGMVLHNAFTKRRNANAPTRGAMHPALTGAVSEVALDHGARAILGPRPQKSTHHRFPDRQMPSEARKLSHGPLSWFLKQARADGMRSASTPTQALSRPDNLAHDTRKGSLGNAEYPAARLLLDRSWGKGRS
jgi:hypothetical protein